MMNGIHIHSHDVEDEGINAITQRLNTMGDIKYIFAQVNSIFERNPVPIGILPHNPKNSVVMGDGTLQVHVDFTGCELRQKLAENVTHDYDYFQSLNTGLKHTNFEVIPWVNVLNGHFEGNVDQCHVVDYLGQVKKHWVCPNGAGVLEFWNRTFSTIKNKYGYSTFLIDRIRFPDWAGESIDPDQLFTCFCDKCKTKMKQVGIDVTKTIERIHYYVTELNSKNYQPFGEHFKDDPIIQAWTKFKQDSITDFVEALTQQNSDVTLWLDLWSPKYSWLLGQNYRELTKHSNALKHFPYHKLGGGADVQGLIEHYADTEQQREDMFRAFLSVFSMPYELTYSQFKEFGYPISFVKDMNNHVRIESQPGTFIFSGIQMWNLEADELIEAVKAANSSEANALLYYCYGWAGDDLFEAVSHFNKEVL
ncbi:hypothetical protein [Vibrio cionasavignyae]|uniref:hypothetical protein n=1 Tax=Vibrio cionasavignyae TaxID=2910252 RepID=UPI003D129DB4